MARKARTPTKRQLDAARRRKREWAAKQRALKKVDTVDAPVDVKPAQIPRLKLTPEELAQPLAVAADQTFREIMANIREKARNGEKVIGEELKFLDKMRQESLAASNPAAARTIAQDQINTVLQTSRPKALQVALEILDDRSAPAAQRMDAARFVREWADAEEPPAEQYVFTEAHPERENVTHIFEADRKSIPITEAKH